MDLWEMEMFIKWYLFYLIFFAGLNYTENGRFFNIKTHILSC